VLTKEGGTLAEETVYVDEAPPEPPGDAIFGDGFEAGLGPWSSANP